MSAFGVKAQTIITGSVQDGLYGEPIPFCIIDVGGKYEVLTNGSGEFTVSDTSNPEYLVFRSPLHRDVKYSIKSDSQNIEMRLPMRSLFLPFKYSEAEAVELLDKWKSKSTRTPVNIQYSSKSKTIISSNDIAKFKRNIGLLFELFDQRLAPFEKDHYLTYQELYEMTELKNEYNLNHEQEDFKSAGVERPTDVLGVGKNPNWSIFDEFWNIGGTPYVNPLAGELNKRYFFQIEDTSKTKNGIIYFIRFGPGLKKVAGRLRGYILYNQSTNQIQALWAESSTELNSRIRISIATEALDGREYSSKITFRQNLTSVQSYNTLLKLNYVKNVSTITRNREIGVKQFDEFIREYASDDKYQTSSFTSNDSMALNTLTFYQKNPQLKNIYTSFNFGKQVGRGKIPLGLVDLETDKIINYNGVEGLRLGMGFISTERASKRLVLEGYSGYGFGDQRVKYGTGLKYYFDDRNQHSIRAAGRNDVYESGQIKFDQQLEPMYRSEKLRKYRINVMDNIISGDLEVNNRLFKNLESQLRYSYSELNPTYQYAFRNGNESVFRYSAIGLGIKYTPRQTRTRIGRESYINKSPLPDFYLQWSHFGRHIGSAFSFNKYEFRLNYQKRILGYGKSSLQVNYGILDRSVPYHQLFVAQGGLRNFSVVFRNTFETMRYNEFASDRYLAIFYSHNFGPLYIPFLNHFPSIEMLHNFGIGSLANRADHSGLEFQVMNRGFMESGAFLKDIIVINSSGLKTGIGAGFFYRYGAYQNPLFRENIVFKFALSLDL